MSLAATHGAARLDDISPEPPDTILVRTEDAAAQESGRDLRIVHDSPTVDQQGDRLLGIDTVPAPPTD